MPGLKSGIEKVVYPGVLVTMHFEMEATGANFVNARTKSRDRKRNVSWDPELAKIS